MNRISREEIYIIAFFALFFIGVGFISGWGARTISSRDRYLVSTAERHNIERDWYQKQFDQVIKEGSKAPDKERK